MFFKLQRTWLTSKSEPAAFLFRRVIFCPRIFQLLISLRCGGVKLFSWSLIHWHLATKNSLASCWLRRNLMLKLYADKLFEFAFQWTIVRGGEAFRLLRFWIIWTFVDLPSGNDFKRPQLNAFTKSFFAKIFTSKVVIIARHPVTYLLRTPPKLKLTRNESSAFNV